MAKKNGETEGEAPVKKAPAGPEEKYRKVQTQDLASLQFDRRELEAELAAIDGRIRDAINNGDLAALDKLVARKADLPRLFIVASNAERQARREKAAAEDEANLAALQTAEAALADAHAAMVALKIRHEQELAAMKAEVSAAEVAVSEAYGAVEGSRALGATADAGFKKSLAGLASV